MKDVNHQPRPPLSREASKCYAAVVGLRQELALGQHPPGTVLTLTEVSRRWSLSEEDALTVLAMLTDWGLIEFRGLCARVLEPLVDRPPTGPQGLTREVIDAAAVCGVSELSAAQMVTEAIGDERARRAVGARDETQQPGSP
jgi:hypothetical protein